MEQRHSRTILWFTVDLRDLFFKDLCRTVSNHNSLYICKSSWATSEKQQLYYFFIENRKFPLNFNNKEVISLSNDKVFSNMLMLHSYWMDHLFYACTYMKTTKLLFAMLLQDHRHFINMSVLVCFLLVKTHKRFT